MDEELKAALDRAFLCFASPMIAELTAEVLSGRPARVTEELQRQCVAAAVAAFLRRMPWLHYEPEELGHGENMTGAELADAIERAVGAQ
jgi:hypothetical protein